MEKRLSAINKENHESLTLEYMCAHVPSSRTASLRGRGQAPMGAGQGTSTPSWGSLERILFASSPIPIHCSDSPFYCLLLCGPLLAWATSVPAKMKGQLKKNLG